MSVNKYNSVSGLLEPIAGNGGSSSGGHTIEDSTGTALTQRTNLQFTDGLNATDDSGNDATVVSGSALATKTDIATVESGSTASRAYSVGELVYVNGNLYKVIVSISQGSAFTVGTNIQVTTVSGALGNWEYLGQTTGNAEITIPANATEVYARATYTSTSASFHFLTVEDDISVDRASGYYGSASNYFYASFMWTKSTRKAKLYSFNFASTEYVSNTTTKWYVK